MCNKSYHFMPYKSTNPWFSGQLMSTPKNGRYSPSPGIMAQLKNGVREDWFVSTALQFLGKGERVVKKTTYFV